MPYCQTQEYSENPAVVVDWQPYNLQESGLSSCCCVLVQGRPSKVVVKITGVGLLYAVPYSFACKKRFLVNAKARAFVVWLQTPTLRLGHLKFIWSKYGARMFLIQRYFLIVDTVSPRR